MEQDIIIDTIKKINKNAKNIWFFKIKYISLHCENKKNKSWGVAVVASKAHNLEVGGSNPPPATL